MRRLMVLLVALGAGLASLAPVHGQVAASPTFADVAPIFNSKCAGCHMKGGIAPFSLTSPTDARAHAQLIKIMTQGAVMPPWPPARDSRPFVGEGKRQLTGPEKDLIARWVDGGAQLGPHVAPPPEAVRTEGARLPTAHRVSAARPSVGLDDYHCTLLDPKLPMDGWSRPRMSCPAGPTSSTT